MVIEASPNKEHLEFVDDSVKVMRKKNMELRIQSRQSRNDDHHKSDNPTIQCHDFMQSKGFMKQRG